MPKSKKILDTSDLSKMVSNPPLKKTIEVATTTIRLNIKTPFDNVPIQPPPNGEPGWEPISAEFVGVRPIYHAVTWKREALVKNTDK